MNTMPQWGNKERSDEKLYPDMIRIFFETIVQKLNCHNIYIPHAKGKDVIDFHDAGLSVAYQNINAEICSYIKEKTGIDALPDAEVDGKKFDVVIANLPLLRVMCNAMHLSIVDKACKIGFDKYAIFSINGDITLNTIGKKWLNNLEENGIFASAIIDLPSGVYTPVSLVASKIIIFSKGEKDDVFLAKVNDIQDIELVITNFLNHKSSKIEHLGKWVIRGEYPDYLTYENHNRILNLEQKLERNYQGELKSLSDLHVKLERSPKTGFQDEIESVIYIPRIGKSNVVTRIADFTLKSQNYFRLIIDHNKIFPEFLAFVLNTEAGIELRLRYMTGAGSATIPSLNSADVLDIKIPVPDIEFQIKILKLDDELQQIATTSSNLREKLRKMPAAYRCVIKEMKDINNKGDKFEQWIEEMPYPMATILKKYQVAIDEAQKQEMLLFFFEAYSIFETAILVGAYGKNLCADKDSIDVSASFFEKASFGSWVKMNRALSKSIRKRVDDKKSMDTILECFHTEDRGTIKALCNNEICKILQTAADNRNSWRGHSGITSEKIYGEHVRVLEKDLYEFQSKMREAYENIQLVRPVYLKRKDGIFINTVEILTGSNAIFKKGEIKGDMALEEGKLYIRMLDSDGVFELPPFLVMKNSPIDAKNACYFYSRLEGNNTKYISYHYEGQPEDIEIGKDAYGVIKSVLAD